MATPVHASRHVDRPPLARSVADCSRAWSLRDQAVRSARCRMPHLVALDQQIENSHALLMQAGDEAWVLALDQLAAGVGSTELHERRPGGTGGPAPRVDHDTPPGPGDTPSGGAVFTAALIAFASRRADHIRASCDAAVASPAGQRGLIAALAWLPFEPLAPILQRLVAAPDARLRRVAVRVLGLHRRDPFNALKPALLDDDTAVVATAARSLGESRRHDAVPLLASRSVAAPEAARYGMASSLLLLGCRDALPLLEAMAEEGGPSALAALGLVLRCLPPPQGRHLLSRLSSRPGAEPLVVAGTGMLGDPVAVPWLLARMDDPALGKLASEAFSLITGADQPDEQPALWWERHGGTLSKGSRHLCGRAITPEALADVLRTGDQRQRQAAALEWALLDDGQPVFDVRQRSDAQLRALNATPWAARR